MLNRFFLLVAKSKSQEAFLAVMLLTVIALSSITEGLGLSGTLGAFLAGTLLSETRYTPQVRAHLVVGGGEGYCRPRCYRRRWSCHHVSQGVGMLARCDHASHGLDPRRGVLRALPSAVPEFRGARK